MAQGHEARKNREALNILSGERGNREDAAQRRKEVRDLQILIADLRKKANGIDRQITQAEAAISDISDQIEDLEADIPLIVDTVGDIEDALLGGTSGNFYSKGGAALGGVWRSVVGLLSNDSILEYGDNADGSFVRLRGGLLICLSPVISATVTVATSVTDLYQSAGDVWTFPRAFSSSPWVSACGTDDSRAWAVPHDATLTQTSCRLKAHASIGSAVSFRLKAEGYW